MKTPLHLIALTSGAVGAASGATDGLINLGFGLLGVVLARWVFINKENRRLQRREDWNHTLPLTLVAMLIAGVLIWDREMRLSFAVFTGLGSGWATVAILDLLGEKATSFFEALRGIAPRPGFPPSADFSGEDGKLTKGDRDIPDDMKARLEEMKDERSES